MGDSPVPYVEADCRRFGFARTFSIGRRALRSRLQWFAAIASFLALSLLHIPLPWIMGMIVAMGVILGLFQCLRGIDRASSEKKTAGCALGAAYWRTMRIVGGCAATGSLPLLLLWIFARDFPFWIRLSAFSLKQPL